MTMLPPVPENYIRCVYENIIIQLPHNEFGISIIIKVLENLKENKE